MTHPAINAYYTAIRNRYNQGNATEHTYRGDLQTLLTALGENLIVTNEPRRQECGAPDYIVTRKEIPLGFIEAKDIGDYLDKTEKGEQLKRYKESLDNLILTDYLEFRMFRFGEKVSVIRIASVDDGKIQPLKGNWQAFEDLIQEFYSFKGQTITSAEKLAKMMAGKAKMMHEVIEKALMADLDPDPYAYIEETSSLQQQYKAFKDVLIHDIKPGEFADIYAQTIAYGMFAARLNDSTLDDFSRKEAADLVPKSNPFLRKLFQHIAGYDLDLRLVWIVDALAEVFAATDVKELLKDFGISTQTTDPMIHFYETFLGEYNPALRKSRGVYYTPQPIVNFIVRAVDDILKEEFGLPIGLADTSKTRIKVMQNGKPVEREVHKVQILDPATGTGTFLAEVIRQVYQKFEGQQGVWNDYVEQHLIPRINGFEILMASYTMCHLKLSMLLRETGYKPYEPKRLKVYLTNSLEEAGENKRDLFTQWLTDESLQANSIKRDTPVMVVMGNPPYSGESSNKGEWIMKLMEDYKKEPGGNEKLKEKNSKFINDDYVKFIRFGQYLIDKNEVGILAFINPHGFLDNPTYRGMRWSLLNSFDYIYSIDLHGNSKKRETTIDGSTDVNVFDIEQGVSINIFVKKGQKNKNCNLGQIYHFDLFGKRETKYEFLIENTLVSIPFIKFIPFKNSFLFKSIDEDKLKYYNLGFTPNHLFNVSVMGFQTHRDDFAIDFEMTTIKNRLKDLINKELSNDDIYKKYSIIDNRDWKLTKSREEIQSDLHWEKKAIYCGYRPFDERPCYYSNVTMDYPRKELIQNIVGKNNILLGIGRQGLAIGDIGWCLTTVSKKPVDANVFRRGGVNLYPLYVYPETNGQQTIYDCSDRIPNLNSKFTGQIADYLKLSFTLEKETTPGTFAPIDLLDYIYAVLHSPAYREKYKEFLKIDFPRVPYPTDTELFWKLVALGGEIRQLHLLESQKVNQFITTYPVEGDNSVVSVSFEGEDKGRVKINSTQYFEGVPRIAWEFYIGGYQPAQKWLKDRKGRILSFEDIMHYQRIIVALTETNRLMGEIDKVLII